MSVGVVVLEVVERMVVPDPWFDHHTPIPLCGGLEKVPDLWGNLLVDQVVKEPEMVLVVR